jgi:hypothetical protein
MIGNSKRLSVNTSNKSNNSHSKQASKITSKNSVGGGAVLDNFSTSKKSLIENLGKAKKKTKLQTKK